MNEQYFYFWIFIIKSTLIIDYTAWKVSKYGVISGPYFPEANLKTNKTLVLHVFLHSRY